MLIWRSVTNRRSQLFCVSQPFEQIKPYKISNLTNWIEFKADFLWGVKVVKRSLFAWIKDVHRLVDIDSKFV